MPIDRRRLIFGSVSGLSAQMLAGASSAQNWPSKNIVIVVPFPAGGSADLSARLLAEHLRGAFGQPAIVENKPGAGGNLAAAEADVLQRMGTRCSSALTARRRSMRVYTGNCRMIRRPISPRLE